MPTRIASSGATTDPLPILQPPPAPTATWFDQNAPAPAPALAAPNPMQGQLSQGFNSGAPGGSYSGVFQAPNLNETTDPGYRFRLDEQQRAITNSQFGRGQGLTGGAARDLAKYQGGLASQEYQNVFNRQLAGDTFNRDTSFGNTDRALNSYLASRDTFWGDNDRLFGRNFSVATLGQNAALGYGTQLGQYGAAGSGLYTGIGNSQAAGTIGQGNAYSRSVGDATNMAALLALQQQGKSGQRK